MSRVCSAAKVAQI